MAVESTMLPLGTKASDFSLPDVISGQIVSIKDFADKKALLLMFICRHCPYVKHIQEEIAKIDNDYQDKDIGILAISSNDPDAYPEDAPNSLKEQAYQLGFTYPYLFDEKQDVAKAYKAACTPDFYLFDKEIKLVYRGQFDDSRPGNNIPVTGKDLRNAIDCVLSGKPVNSDKNPAWAAQLSGKKTISQIIFNSLILSKLFNFKFSRQVIFI